MSAAADFRRAVEAEDLEAVRGLLAEDIVLHSPVTFWPYVGRETVGDLLAIVFSVFEDFRYVAEMGGGSRHGLVFNARVGERDIEGIDMITENADRLISEFTVMLRPMSALIPFAQTMNERVTAAGLQTTRA